MIRFFLMALGYLGAMAWDSRVMGTEFGRPNILVIVSDDQGYGDAGFQGCADIPTPNLDALAKTGVLCTNGYVTHCFCSPTRAGLLTGRYQQRFGHEFNPVYDPLDRNEGLPLSEKLLPQYLREVGYRTGWVGKWHLGSSPEHQPGARGFEETFGFIGGGHRFLGWKPNGRQYTLPIERNGKPVEVTGHLTTRFGKEARAFVEKASPAPWFLYLAFNAPHMPHEPTPEKLARFDHIQDMTRRKYAAQLSLMDDAIGDLVKALETTGQRERTLVFFFSDNGGPARTNGSKNGALRGQKGDLYEGGIRVPFVVSWPGTLPAGVKYREPVVSLDAFGTALAVAGIKPPDGKKIDGVDLVPFLKGEKKGAPHDRLYWRKGGGVAHALREGNWKIIRGNNQATQLYNLAEDVGESRDLAIEKPGELARLSASLEDLEKQMVKPAFLGSSVKNEDWGPGGANQQKQGKP